MDLHNKIASKLLIKYKLVIKNISRNFSFKSLAPEGTILKGINIYKKGMDPMALKESEYPDWLWKILDDSKISDEKIEKKKKFKKDNKEKIKSNNFLRSRL
ncbi:hypothetical protein PNEG_02833 [Pneumocystis murina B123]|uniref:Large ribosomal subunit protein mL54 n=1 Tax=Pneumocystis murina (strain B123) TaxID=1069680 RepID=M7NP72_PNEMU|nr:hypothetical protein PNEG_02833 [Pneumocystis murina B123]EMR09062.1 hypothetical protein PNEG_02833 [Pneumocystis murina B123]